MGSIRGRARAGLRGMIPLEAFVVVLATMGALGVLYGFLRGPTRTPPPSNPIERCEAAAQTIARSIRRDVRWARSFTIEDKGHRLVLVGPEKETRTYTYLPGKLAISLPVEGEPGRSEEWTGAQFRELLFISREPETIKYVIAAFPEGRTLSAKASKRDRDLSRVICGSVTLERNVATRDHPWWTP